MLCTVNFQLGSISMFNQAFLIQFDSIYWHSIWVVYSECFENRNITRMILMLPWRELTTQIKFVGNVTSRTTNFHLFRASLSDHRVCCSRISTATLHGHWLLFHSDNILKLSRCTSSRTVPLFLLLLKMLEKLISRALFVSFRLTN